MQDQLVEVHVSLQEGIFYEISKDEEQSYDQTIIMPREIRDLWSSISRSHYHMQSVLHNLMAIQIESQYGKID